MPRGDELKKLETEKGIIMRFVIGHSTSTGGVLDRAIEVEDEQHKVFFFTTGFCWRYCWCFSDKAIFHAAGLGGIARVVLSVKISIFSKEKIVNCGRKFIKSFKLLEVELGKNPFFKGSRVGT